MNQDTVGLTKGNTLMGKKRSKRHGKPKKEVLKCPLAGIQYDCEEEAIVDTRVIVTNTWRITKVIFGARSISREFDPEVE